MLTGQSEYWIGLVKRGRPVTSYLLVLSLIVLLLALSGLAYAANEGSGCAGKSPREISRVFDRAIAANEQFKNAVNDWDEPAYRMLRAQVEHYGEEIAFPCASRAASILAKKYDKKLMRDLMRFAISFENSADETLSYSFGIIFTSNPSAIEHSIKIFSSDEQAIIANTVEAGWENTKREVAANIVKDRDARITRLKR